MSTSEKFLLGSVACSTYSISQFLEEVRRLLKDKSLSPRTILCLNAHIFNESYINKELESCLNSARIVTADGMAIAWAARLFGKKTDGRCNMTEAYHAFLVNEQMPPSRGILIGCSEREAAAAAEKANKSCSHCQISKTYSGFLTASEYQQILSAHADVDFIFLGMGTPKTEIITELAGRICPRVIVWGIGGGTIRIEAGTMTEAPLFLRRLGLQWLYRLMSDPRNLWRRYLIGNPLFAGRILKKVITQWRG